MQGYRTIIFTLLMTLIGLLGVKVSPDLANHWLDVFFAVWGIGAILLRQITTTPVGAAINPEIEAVLAHLKQLSAQLGQGLSRSDIDSLAADLKTLLSLATSDTALAGHTSKLASAIGELTPVLQALIAGLQAAPTTSISTSITSPSNPSAAAATLAAVDAAPTPSDDGLPPAPSEASAQPLSAPVRSGIIPAL